MCIGNGWYVILQQKLKHSLRVHLTIILNALCNGNKLWYHFRDRLLMRSVFFPQKIRFKFVVFVTPLLIAYGCCFVLGASNALCCQKFGLWCVLPSPCLYIYACCAHSQLFSCSYLFSIFPSGMLITSMALSYFFVNNNFFLSRYSNRLFETSTEFHAVANFWTFFPFSLFFGMLYDAFAKFTQFDCVYIYIHTHAEIFDSHGTGTNSLSWENILRQPSNNVMLSF